NNERGNLRRKAFPKYFLAAWSYHLQIVSGTLGASGQVRRWSISRGLGGKNCHSSSLLSIVRRGPAGKTVPTRHWLSNNPLAPEQPLKAIQGNGIPIR